MVRAVIGSRLRSRVTSLQFLNECVILGSCNIPNRWLITVSDVTAREELITSGLPTPTAPGLPSSEEKITVKLYDDVMADDFEEFRSHVEYIQKLSVHKKNPKPKKKKRKH